MKIESAALSELLKKYAPKTRGDYVNALKEVTQEIVLMGLWRGKFFEHAAFYGGTALRILYGLDRFSEDLDFSLLSHNPSFTIETYFPFITQELESYGMSVSIEKKAKSQKTAVESAFLKTTTEEHLIKLGISQAVSRGHKDERIKIKLDVDTSPPPQFETENQFLLQPNPFSVKTFVPSDLFAGKVHALLYRNWGNRLVKGRDWYDFVWYIKNSIPLNINYLEQRLLQTPEHPNIPLTKERLKELLKEKISSLNVEAAKRDVLPFLRDASSIEVWSHDFFHSLVHRVQFL